MQDALHLYHLIPQLPLDDPNWQNCLPQGDVIVRARTAADARVVAAEAEGDFAGLGAKPAEGVSTLQGSAFLSEKLYTVRLADETAAVGSERGVVRGPINTLANARPHEATNQEDHHDNG